MLYLWIYFDEHVKDFYLPSAQNWTGELRLYQAETGWQEDTRLAIRALDDVWYVAPAQGFRWQDRDAPAGERTVKSGDRRLMTNGVRSIGLVVSSYEKHNTEFSKYALPRGTGVTIGRAEASAIRFDDSLVSLRHAEFVKAAGGACQYRDTSLNGSYINGARVKLDVRELAFGDIVTIPTGLKIVYLGDMIAVNRPDALRKVDLPPYDFEVGRRAEGGGDPPSAFVEYHRAPRLLERPDRSAIQIEPPLARQQKEEQPLFLTLGPPMTMILPMLAGTLIASLGGGNRSYMASGMAMIGASSILAVSWGMASARYRKKRERRAEWLRVERYRAYLKETETRLRAANTFERLRLAGSFPSVQECAALIGGGSLRLWERMPSHEDFLSVRLGIGDVPLPGEILTEVKRLSIIDDPLRDEPQRLKDAYGVVRGAPVTVSLRGRPVLGILGREDAVRLAQGIVVQIAAMHSYTDVKLCVLYDENNRSRWAWTRWLPHVFSQDRRMRMSVCKPGAVREVLSGIDEVLRLRAEGLRARRQEGGVQPEDAPLPHYVIVATRPELVERSPALSRLLSEGLGATLVILAPSMERLPKECALIASVQEEDQGLFTAEGDVSRLRFEFPPDELASAFARRLAPMRISDPAENASIPTLAPFLRTSGVTRVEELDIWRFWNENMACEGLRSTIGLRAGGAPFVLDISERFHGPHGLVAGTTGSGKSVMLQTYILSLAINYHPQQVQFILIDYKGGGMSEALKSLPHIAGRIDNLQGERTVLRALASIQGEIRRREAAFKRVGVVGIDEYIRLFHGDPEEEPIAHLIIVVDEFAELKTENKDFVHDLVSASRVGRSVGVHLILATQKPSTSVDEEIWSNTRFRLCLRVSSRSDSTDMLKRPDAAYIKGMGRCYVQVGSDELFEEVQTLYSGAAYKPDEVSAEQLPRMLDDLGAPIATRSARRGTDLRETTEMDAVLGRIREVAQEHSVARARALWKEEVPTRLSLDDIEDGRAERFDGVAWPEAEPGRIRAVIGLADDVMGQRHLPVWADFTQNRNHLFVGMATSGKTTLIQTLAVSLALRYSPEELQIYIFSLSSRTLGCLAGLPHVGGIVYEDEAGEQLRLLHMLERESERRQALFTLAATDSHPEYCRAARQHPDLAKVPAIVVAIDRMLQARELMDEEGFAKLSALIREGSGRGIYFAATAMSLGEVPVRLQPSFRNLALELRESRDYAELLGGRMPPEMSGILPAKGRGMARFEGGLMEMQTALYGAGELDVERAARIAELGREMAGAWRGALPAAIPRIPEGAAWPDLLAAAGAEGDRFSLPMGYLSLEGTPFSADLFRDHAWLVTGPRQSGKTALLRGLALSLRRQNAEVHVIADPSWREFADRNGLTLYTQAGPELEGFMLSLRETALARNARRKQASGPDRLELRRDFEPIALLIDDLDQAGWLHPSIVKYLAMTAASAEGFGICLIASASHQGLIALRNSELAASLAARQAIVALGGRLVDCPALQNQLPFPQRSQALPIGQGWLIRRAETRKLLIPKA